MNDRNVRDENPRKLGLVKVIQCGIKMSVYNVDSGRGKCVLNGLSVS